jgi:LacI family transcriptional regulator
LNQRTAEVSEATRRRVWTAVEALGYQPNALARSLAGRPTRTFGLAWVEGANSLAEDGLSAFLTGLGEVLFSGGYALTLAGGVAPAEFASRLDELLARQVDGLLLLAAGFPGEERLLRRLAAQTCPLVVCGPRPEGLPAARVDVDQREGMRLAAAHLLDLGHRRLAYLDAPGDWPYRLRREGFRAAVEAVHPSPETLCLATDGCEAGGYQAGERLLREVDRPTAFVGANEALAIGFMRAAWREGIGIPERAAVVGFGDSPAAAYTIPALTTVRGSLRAVGAAAGRILAEAAAEGTTAQGTCLIPPKLVVRESCGSALWL